MIIPVGSGGLSKCSIIVHIDSGSTVAAYSNASATTKVKDAKEIGTSGDYLITGLNVGTYYVKATKNTDETISGAVVFLAVGVVDLPMSYAVPIFGLAYQTWSTIQSNTTIIGFDGTYRQFKNSSPYVEIYCADGNQGVPVMIWKTAVAPGKRYLNIRYKKTGSGDYCKFGLSSSSGSLTEIVSASIPASNTETVASLLISSVTSNAYLYVTGASGENDVLIKEAYLT